MSLMAHYASCSRCPFLGELERGRPSGSQEAKRIAGEEKENDFLSDSVGTFVFAEPELVPTGMIRSQTVVQMMIK